MGPALGTVEDPSALDQDESPVRAEGSEGQGWGYHLAQHPACNSLAPSPWHHHAHARGLPAGRPQPQIASHPCPPHPCVPLSGFSTSLGGTGMLPLTGYVASENDWTTLSFCLQVCTARGKTTLLTLPAAARPGMPGP